MKLMRRNRRQLWRKLWIRKCQKFIMKKLLRICLIWLPYTFLMEFSITARDNFNKFSCVRLFPIGPTLFWMFFGTSTKNILKTKVSFQAKMTMKDYWVRKKRRLRKDWRNNRDTSQEKWLNSYDWDTDLTFVLSLTKKQSKLNKLLVSWENIWSRLLWFK